ncbi:transposase [Streptomyces rimosus]
MQGSWELTNAEWDRLESILPRGGTRGGRRSDHRRVTNGVLYRVRTGAQ